MSELRHTAFKQPPGLAGCAFACGTRAAYVRGCRCPACRAANSAYAREREVRRRQRVDELLSGDQPPRGRRRCPGVEGEPCAKASFVRCDSQGGICRSCRVSISREGEVSSEPARAHLERLSRAGIGSHTVADSSGVSRTIILKIVAGRRPRIRARTERALLAVDETCRADGAAVDAAPAWRAVRRLLRAGMSRGAIARALGNQTPALQIGRRAVLLRTADRLERLADRVERDRAPRQRAKRDLERLVAGANCPRCGESHRDDLLAARWCLEHVEAPLSREERLPARLGGAP